MTEAIKRILDLATSIAWTATHNSIEKLVPVQCPSVQRVADGRLPSEDVCRRGQRAGQLSNGFEIPWTWVVAKRNTPGSATCEPLSNIVPTRRGAEVVAQRSETNLVHKFSGIIFSLEVNEAKIMPHRRLHALSNVLSVESLISNGSSGYWNNMDFRTVKKLVLVKLSPHVWKTSEVSFGSQVLPMVHLWGSRPQRLLPREKKDMFQDGKSFQSYITLKAKVPADRVPATSGWDSAEKKGINIFMRMRSSYK
ncbi:hypothetical protein IW261DRAFT_1417781 [Armillaria novae-zelandiae]|uniref:Uncharacterized protein n=1 Tax=Armillaria novae-zelandiae TaxID=153914 RepID=A0AA39PHA1_9AGAR|nr:hypothetical protein IW261DRAFT_1417781 [Armillaria novae-zelandiae]